MALLDGASKHQQGLPGTSRRRFGGKDLHPPFHRLGSYPVKTINPVDPHLAFGAGLRQAKRLKCLRYCIAKAGMSVDGCCEPG